MRGDSGQGEAKRTNSTISDALVDGAMLEWEKCHRFKDLSEEEIKATSLHSYEQYEKAPMEKCLAHLQAGCRKDRRCPCPEGLHLDL